MPEVIEPLSPVRVLAKPKRFAPLRGFSCGRKGHPWEKLVNEWARSVYLGTQMDAQTVVVLEDAHGKLVGVGSFRPEPTPVIENLPKRIEALMGSSQYIHMVAIDRLYHGQRAQDGSRLGDVLMRGMLAHIERVGDGRLPTVWAHVAPDNARAHALFERHGFGELPYAGEGDITRIRYADGVASVASGGIKIAHWIARRRTKV